MQSIHDQLKISLYHVERASYKSLQLVDNTHPYWALSYVLDGAVETICRGYTFPVQAGDVMVHPPGVAYSELASGPGTHEWLLLDVSLSSQVELLRLYPVAPVVRLGAASADFSRTFRELLGIWQDEQLAFRGLQMVALTTKLLSLILTSWEQAGRVARPAAMLTSEDRFTTVLNFMADHLHEKISRERLAAVVNFHPVYFDRVFRQTYGVPPMQMLREMRLQRGQMLLESSAESISEIAFRCGFGSTALFTRLFSARFGQAPGDYRQGLKQAKERYMPFLSPH